MFTNSNAQKMHYVLRIATAMCFIGHGAFGIITKPVWCNYFAVFGIGRNVAYQLMPVVGVVDIIMGITMLFYPVRVVAGWLVVWGAVTASLRPVSGEPFAEMIERAGNFGAPLALLLLHGISPFSVRGWFKRISPYATAEAVSMKQVKMCLQAVVFLLLLGHGWLNVIEKNSLLGQYISLGFSSPAQVARIIGIAEIAAALMVLIRPVRPLLLVFFIWKAFSELFYPHYEIFEWVERGGSYGSILALWLVVKPGVAKTNRQFLLNLSLKTNVRSLVSIYKTKTTMNKNILMQIVLMCTVLLVLNNNVLHAQTDEDAIMMAKKQFCIGGMYSNGSWKNYWEGTLKRNNLNLGTVSSQMFGFMGTYGVSEKLNLLINLPYVTTKASAGTLHGQHGLQDASLWVKWMPLEKDLGKGTFSLYTLGGVSFPTTNYIADYLPLSIGLHSTNLSGRLLADYQLGRFFATVSGTYTLRSNTTTDRTAYYTTEMHYTNKIAMPDEATEQLRTGYRSSRLIAEATVTNTNTLGGFDIRRNDMPFPSNKMNSTKVGVNVKYTFKSVEGLSLIGGGSYTVAGRNVGQTTMFNAGVFYILDFNHAAKSSSASKK